MFVLHPARIQGEATEIVDKTEWPPALSAFLLDNLRFGAWIFRGVELPQCLESLLTRNQ